VVCSSSSTLFILFFRKNFNRTRSVPINTEANIYYAAGFNGSGRQLNHWTSLHCARDPDLKQRPIQGGSWPRLSRSSQRPLSVETNSSCRFLCFCKLNGSRGFLFLWVCAIAWSKWLSSDYWNKSETFTVVDRGVLRRRPRQTRLQLTLSSILILTYENDQSEPVWQMYASDVI